MRADHKANDLSHNLHAILTHAHDRRLAEEKIQSSLHDQTIFSQFDELIQHGKIEDHALQLFYVILKNAVGSTKFQFDSAKIVALRRITLELLFVPSIKRILQDTLLNFLWHSYRSEHQRAWDELLLLVVPNLRGDFGLEKLRSYAVTLRIVHMVTKLNWHRYISFSTEDDDTASKKDNYNEFNAYLWKTVMPFVYQLLWEIFQIVYAEPTETQAYVISRTAASRCLIGNPDLWCILHFIAKTFWSCSLNDIDKYVHWDSQRAREEQAREWAESILFLGRLPLDVVRVYIKNRAVEPGCPFDTSETAEAWKVVKWVLTFVNCLLNSPQKALKLGFFASPGRQIAELLHLTAVSRAAGVLIAKKPFVTALGCMEIVLRRKNFLPASLSIVFFEQLVDTAFYAVRFVEADEELFRHSPAAFVEASIEEFHDTYDSRSASCRLLKTLVTSKLAQKLKIPEQIFERVRRNLNNNIEMLVLPEWAPDKYALGCVVYRLSSVIKKRFAPLAIWNDYIKFFGMDLAGSNAPYLEFMALLILQEYARTLKRIPDGPLGGAVERTVSRILQESIGSTDRMAIQVQQMQTLAAFVEVSKEISAPIVLPEILKLMDVGIRLSQLDSGIQPMILTALSTFIDHFPEQLDPILSQLCKHFIDHVHRVYSEYRQLQEATAGKPKSTSVFEDTKIDEYDDEEFRQQENVNSAIESTLRTLYTITSTMVLKEKWYGELQKLICPFLSELLAVQDEAVFSLMESREIVFDIFDLICTNVSILTSESWELVHIACRLILSEDDQFFVCECGSKMFSIGKAFLAQNQAEFMAKNLSASFFDICNVFLNPTRDSDEDFFDDFDRSCALDFVSFYLQEHQGKDIYFSDGLRMCLSFVVKKLQSTGTTGPLARLTFALYRVMMSLAWVSPEMFATTIIENKVPVEVWVENYCELLIATPRVSVCDRQVSIIGLSCLINWLIRSPSSVRIGQPELEGLVQKIATALRKLLISSYECHSAQKDTKLSSTQDMSADDADFETEEDDDSDEDDYGTVGSHKKDWYDEVDDDEDDDDCAEDTPSKSMRLNASAVVKDLLVHSPQVRKILEGAGIEQQSLDGLIQAEENFRNLNVT